jgi:hypothetical protein
MRLLNISDFLKYSDLSAIPSKAMVEARRPLIWTSFRVSDWKKNKN